MLAVERDARSLAAPLIDRLGLESAVEMAGPLALTRRRR
jgi:hypothetical protein